MTMATQQLWQTFSDALRKYFRRRVDDPQLADDLLQETFLRIHRGLEQVEQPDRLSAWVYRIARHVLIDQYRRHDKNTASLEDEPATVEEDTTVPELAACVAEMVGNLQPPYRDAVALAELEGLTQREVAERLGLSISGAKSRVQRGRRQLKQLVLQCCQLEFDRRGNAMDYETRDNNGNTCSCCNDDVTGET